MCICYKNVELVVTISKSIETLAHLDYNKKTNAQSSRNCYRTEHWKYTYLNLGNLNWKKVEVNYV